MATRMPMASVTTQTAVTFPSRLKTIGDNAFYDCDRLIAVVLPDSVSKIGTACFSCCDRLSTVTFGSGLKAIGTSAFDSCARLETVNFKNGLESVASNAFTNCPITELIFPDTVTTLSATAFSTNRNNDIMRTTLRKDNDAAFPACV